MFINYAENNIVYRFLILKNDMLDCNTMKQKMQNSLNIFIH
jgi:hypothetical protein